MVTLIGHSHLCKSFALTRDEVLEVVATKFAIRPEDRYIVSVGSVGQPRDYDNRASYTIYDSDEKTFEFKRVEYDIDAAAHKVFAAKLERNFGTASSSACSREERAGRIAGGARDPARRAPRGVRRADAAGPVRAGSARAARGGVLREPARGGGPQARVRGRVAARCARVRGGRRDDAAGAR